MIRATSRKTHRYSNELKSKAVQLSYLKNLVKKINFILFCFCICNVTYGLEKRDLTLTSNSLGPVTRETKFDKETIKKLFPSMQIEKEQIVYGGEGTYSLTLNVSENGKLLFKIVPVYRDEKQPPGISQIRIVSNRIKNSFAPQIGQVFSDVKEGGHLVDCREIQDGDPHLLGDFDLMSCYQKGASNIQYNFAIGDSIEDSEGNLIRPPLKLVAITWLTDN